MVFTSSLEELEISVDLSNAGSWNQSLLNGFYLKDLSISNRSELFILVLSSWTEVILNIKIP